ncbi:putative transmembrane protein [Toxoplasma gondii p89]|uniref:Putative transmembrane protein n=1 Tax=Toxoplasma gondii p89 TaxID=943119 RepID=A0A086JVL0_TOXGO|nr:putative transmembrane protein [Toxoplasma gondii p89]
MKRRAYLGCMYTRKQTKNAHKVGCEVAFHTSLLSASLSHSTRLLLSVSLSRFLQSGVPLRLNLISVSGALRRCLLQLLSLCQKKFSSLSARHPKRLSGETQASCERQCAFASGVRVCRFVSSLCDFLSAVLCEKGKTWILLSLFRASPRRRRVAALRGQSALQRS